MLVFPFERGIADARDGLPKIHAQLLERLAQSKLPVVDLSEALGEKAQSSPLRELVKGHYRPFGNEIVAQALADALPPYLANSCAVAQTEDDSGSELRNR